MLAVENLDLRYGAAQVLWNLSLTATRGQVTCIMGRNGVGKTSLLRGIVGHQPISGGRILWEGKDIAKLAPFERARLGIAYVPQGREIFPLLSVKENLESGYAALKGHSRTIPDEVFELFPVLKTMLSRRGGDLSGGQQQQLAIGRAMVTRPSLMLLDEPTEGIQPSIIKDIGRAIRYLRDKGEIAILLVEQYFDFAVGLADRFAVMDRGQIIVAGTKAEMVEGNVMLGVTSPSDADEAIAPAEQPGKRAWSRATTLQRTFGVIELVFSLSGESTTATRVFQQGALRARFTNGVAGQPPEAVLLNLAGGLTGGDRLDMAVRLHERTSAVVTTQSCERIYRSSANDAVVAGSIRLAQGSQLEWLPQPVIMFDGARLKRETHVELAGDAHLLALESVIFGRTESGETVRSGVLLDGWFVHRNGELIQAECLDLSGEISATLAKAAVLNGNRAIATLRYIAPDAEQRVDQMRAILSAPDAIPAVIAAVSAWNGMMVTRVVAPDGYALNCELTRVLDAFRGKPMPRVWSL